ncbi:hypothetical protein HAX54_045167, partial [Datura stramonium]|nr:hypothetical protein [Datura stramonium]
MGHIDPLTHKKIFLETTCRDAALTAHVSPHVAVLYAPSSSRIALGLVGLPTHCAKPCATRL